MSEKVKKLDTGISYRIKRYWAFLAMSLFAIIIPWITVNGNHLFLLSFDHKKLHLGFVAFDMQEMYLMPFVLILTFLGIFWITVLGGRMFCGWMCPQTIFRVVYRDFIETKILGLRKSIKNKQKEPDYSLFSNQLKKVAAILIWSLLSFLAAANFLWFFVPPEDFFVYILNPVEHNILMWAWIAIALFLIYDVVRLKEDFCIYVCPYSRIQSVMYDDDTLFAIYDTHRGGHVYDQHKEKVVSRQKEFSSSQSECTTCESCVAVCPTNIDIRKGMQLECINCLECVDACTTVMGNLGKESLVRWSSSRETEKREGKTRIVRFKTVGYVVIMIVVFAFMIKIGSEKEHMLLNINKETSLYSITGDKEKPRVTNGYTFLFQNTENSEHEYYFEITNSDKIKILRPKNSFKVKPNVKKKRIVVLYADEIIVKDERQDTPIPIVIRAYSVDNPEISVTRNAVFVYPRYDIIKNYK